MSELNLFHYSGQQVRTVVIDSEPWFVAADVSGILDYRMASDMTRRLDAEDKGYAKVRTPGGDQEVIVISEAGLYDAIFRSNSEGAKPFRRWVTGSVLPAIRKTGSFNITHKPLELPRSFSEALRQLADTCEQLEAVAPKVEAYDALMDASGLYSMQAAAKALGYGPNILYRDLRRLGVLQSNNLPFQRYAGNFDVKLGSYTNRRGETVPTATTHGPAGGSRLPPPEAGSGHAGHRRGRGDRMTARLDDVNASGAQFMLGWLNGKLAAGDITREVWQEALDAAVAFQNRQGNPC